MATRLAMIDPHGTGTGTYHEEAAAFKCGCGEKHESHTAPLYIGGTLTTPGVMWSPVCYAERNAR
jgi:hypothetical protein